MSNYALGAGLQGFVQGATDFMKLYMTFQQMQHEQDYQNKLLNLKQQDTSLKQQAFQQQLESKKKLQDVLGGLTQKQQLTPEDIKKTAIETMPYDVNASKTLLAMVPQETKPKIEIKDGGVFKDPKTGQTYKQFVVFQDGTPVDQYHYPVMDTQTTQETPLKLAEKLMQSGDRLVKTSLAMAKRKLGDQIFLNNVNTSDPNTLVPVLSMLEKYQAEHTEDRNVQQIIDTLREGIKQIEYGNTVISQYASNKLTQAGYTPPQPTQPKPSKPQGQGNYYKHLLGE